MIHNINYEELHSITEVEIKSALIVDLTKLNILKASPVPHVHNICSCKNTEVEFANHCLRCGTSTAELNKGLNSYEMYSILYKFIDIHSKVFDCIAFISNDVLPKDFVGSLSKITWNYAPLLPYRRSIIHISNSIVHTDDFFTLEGITEQTRDRVNFLTIFSSTKEVLDIHKAKIIHSSSLSVEAYLSMIISSAGFPYRYLLS